MVAAPHSGQQAVFDALADPTRRYLISILASSDRLSISDLAEYVPITRQAVSKHLLVIEAAGLVSVEKQGRERLLVFTPKPLSAAATWLREIEAEWDARLENLRRYLMEESETDQDELSGSLG